MGFQITPDMPETQRCPNTRCPVTWTTEFFMVASKILRWFLDF